MLGARYRNIIQAENTSFNFSDSATELASVCAGHWGILGLHVSRLWKVQCSLCRARCDRVSFPWWGSQSTNQRTLDF